MTTMRIAVAGTGGLARCIARCINEDTSHHVVFLSRSPKPDLAYEGFQVAVVNYSNPDSICFALRGIDTVISTVTGANQIELIKAAAVVRVRRFAPAEFEGVPPAQAAITLSDTQKLAARQLLRYYAGQLQSTVFVCGILYERFQPGGLARARIGFSSGLSGQGDYIMDCEAMIADVPVYDASNTNNVTICMTAAQDVARFVTRALDLPTWPAELFMYGQRFNVSELVARVEALRGRRFQPKKWHSPASIASELRLASARGDAARQLRFLALLKTVSGHYDYPHAHLNRLFRDVIPINFDTWFQAQWNHL